MSEALEADAGPNPFSFKSFVKRTSTTESSSFSAGARGRGSTRGTGSRRKGEKGREKKKSDERAEDLPFPDLSDKPNTGTLHGSC